MAVGIDELTERLLKCLKEVDDLNDELDSLKTWTNSLEELSAIIDAFEVDEKNRLQGKTILDVGTSGVKPLYIALKYEPHKIVGINEDFSGFSIASEVEPRSKLLTKTKIRFHSCSLFDEETLKKIMKLEEVEKFDYVLLSKTLHHLRTGKECVTDKRDKEHECQDDKKCCTYRFEPKVFDHLLKLGDRVVVYEAFCPQEEDEDKVRGRGGHFTVEEWKGIFKELSEKYRVTIIRPVRCQLDRKGLERVKAKLRQIDYICFYLEAKLVLSK